MRVKRFRRPEKAKLLCSRRAQVESQFNWIFILIVGALILGFFAYIVIKQKTASEAKFAGTVTKQLNTILVGAKVSSGAEQEIPTPEVSIQFSCTDYFIGPASQRLGNRIVFAPTFIKGNRLQTWTLDWNVPFKVTSFLYLTAPTIRYYIIGPSIEDEKTLQFYDSLPKKMNKQFRTLDEYSSGDILYENDEYVRFIFFNVGPVGTSFNIPVTFSGADHISGLNVDLSSKQVQFLQVSGGALNTAGGGIPYHEPPVLYGAVFSDSVETFNCLMERAYTRLGVISQVYLEKLNAIAPSYAGQSCEGYYLKNQDLQDISAATLEYPPQYGKIGDAVSRLETTNTRLQLQSCPLIY